MLREERLRLLRHADLVLIAHVLLWRRTRQLLQISGTQRPRISNTTHCDTPFAVNPRRYRIPNTHCLCGHSRITAGFLLRRLIRARIRATCGTATRSSTSMYTSSLPHRLLPVFTPVCAALAIYMRVRRTYCRNLHHSVPPWRFDCPSSQHPSMPP